MAEKIELPPLVGEQKTEWRYPLSAPQGKVVGTPYGEVKAGETIKVPTARDTAMQRAGFERVSPLPKTKKAAPAVKE